MDSGLRAVSVSIHICVVTVASQEEFSFTYNMGQFHQDKPKFKLLTMDGYGTDLLKLTLYCSMSDQLLSQCARNEPENLITWKLSKPIGLGAICI